MQARQRRRQRTGVRGADLAEEARGAALDDRPGPGLAGRLVDEAIRRSRGEVQPSGGAVAVDSDQQLGERDEVYEITFDVDGETYTYQTTDANEYARFQRDSEWQLEINGFGDIVGIEPTP